MKQIKAVLVDLSGTIHIDDEEIPGSVKALEKLRSCGKFKIKFVTNTTKESKRKLYLLLKKLKFEIDENEIFTSLTAARKLIDSKQLRPMLFLEPNALEEFEGISTEDPNSVVIGLASGMFDYENLNKAFKLLLNGAKLVGIHKAKFYKRKDGLALGPGAFLSALEFSSGASAEIVGKPTKDFFIASISEFNVSPDECVMIGDDANDDIEGAHNAGFHGILVKTGKYRDNSENALTRKPLLLAENFSHAVDYLLSIN